MTVLLLATLLLLQTKMRFSQETTHAKPVEYGVQIHVQASHLVNECHNDTKGSNCSLSQELTTIIDGKKYYLRRRYVENILRPGDYRARIVEDKQPRTEEYSREYEILFSDGKSGRFDVVGESE